MAPSIDQLGAAVAAMEKSSSVAKTWGGLLDILLVGFLMPSKIL